MATREQIMSMADPFTFMAEVMNGHELEAAAANDSPAAWKAFPTMGQRIHAAKWLGDRLLPPAKGRLLDLSLPEIETAEHITKSLSVIVSAVGSGKISAEEAAALAAVVEVKRKAIETVELEKRITTIEESTK
jgi:hypothetical protein